MVLLLAGAAASLLGDCTSKGKAQLSQQAFERKLAVFWMRISQQQLQREDLRDLFQLCVARMDVYHLMGALLLGVVINLYTKSSMLQGKEETPHWAVALFLVSNLGACGYLILGTWFSMHASVASHTVGVRLLTHFARLSIPTRQELELACNVPLLGWSDFGDAPSNAADDPQASPHEADQEHHLKRFVREQKRWFHYDAHARICMSLGLNQVLHALSYYIIARSTEHHPAAVLCSLLGIAILATMLQRLDVRPRKRERLQLTLTLLGQMAPLFVGLSALLIHRGARGFVTGLCFAFLMHSAWLWYNGVHFGLFSSKDFSALPSRMRAVLWLDVLGIDPSDDEAADGEPSVGLGLPAPLGGLLPSRGSPPEELPREVSRRFTALLAVTWLLAAGLHLGAVLLRPYPSREPSSLPPLLRLSPRGAGCAGPLHETWDLAAVPPAPAGWQHSVVMQPRAGNGSSYSDETLLAGFVNGRVVVASVTMSLTGGRWEVSQRFSVRPRCGGERGCSRAFQDVVALALSQELLAVLHAGGRRVDLWDLSSGNLAGRWSLERAASGLCFRGRELLADGAAAGGLAIAARL